MSLIYPVTFTLGYVLGVLTTVEAYRFHRRRRRRTMPTTPRPGERRIFAFIRRHAVACIMVTVLLDITLSVAVGFLMIRYKQLQDCQNTYLNGSAPLVQARDTRFQALIDDIANHATEETFLQDVKAEQVAAQALSQYRATHVPGKACE